MNSVKNRKRWLALTLGVLLFLQAAPVALAQAAEEEETLAAGTVVKDPRAPEGQFSVVDPEELRVLTEEALEARRLHGERVGIGYCYTPTGETWYYNEGTWFYSASLYKVPLMMLFAEQESKGEISQETILAGSITLGEAEQRILVNSNNELAHLAMDYLGKAQDVRQQYKQYATLPEEEYHKKFLTESYFNARFMTDVMATLYYEPERFPNILDYLKQAKPQGWFQRTGDHEYEIAQKYGVLNTFYHASGVIYTPNPFILTVLTERAGYAEESIAQIKQRFQEYTLLLDQRLEQAREEEEARYREELERQKREEEEAARLKAEEEERLKQEAAEKAAAAVTPEPADLQEEPGGKGWPVAVVGIGGALGFTAGVIAVLRGRQKRRVSARG